MNFPNVPIHKLMKNAQYWSACPERYPFVILALYDYRYGDGYFSDALRSASFEAAKKRVKNDYSTHSYKCFIITREQFNAMLAAYKNGSLKNIDLNELHASQATGEIPVPSKLAGSLVHLVWNLTLGKQEGTPHESAEDALKGATALAVANPVNTYLVLSPTSKVFQPPNVTVEDIN